MDTREHTKKLANDIRTKIYGKEVREALATGIEESGDTSQEARDITENLLDGSYDTGLLNTEIEQRMNNLYSTKGVAMDDLYTEKDTALTNLYENEKAELDNLQADYANRAETLETTYAPRLTEVTAQLAQTDSDLKSRAINLAFPPPPFSPPKADGLTDDSDAIKQIYNSLSDGDTLEIPAGKYKIDKRIVFDKNINVIGHKGKTTFITDTDSPFIFTGKTFEKTYTTNTTDVGNTITVNNAQNIKKGDLVLIKDDSKIWEIDTREGQRYGELNIIKDVVGNNVELEIETSSTYNVNTEITPIKPIQNLTITNLSFVRSNSLNNQESALIMTYTKDCVISDIFIDGYGASGISDNYSVNNMYERVIAKNGNYASNATGYGLQTNGSILTQIVKSTFYNYRRGVDYSGQIPSRFCQARYCTVIGSTEVGGGDSGFGSHGTSEYCEFDSCTVIGTQNAFVLRGNHITLKNSKSYKTKQSFVLSSGGIGHIIVNSGTTDYVPTFITIMNPDLETPSNNKSVHLKNIFTSFYYDFIHIHRDSNGMDIYLDDIDLNAWSTGTSKVIRTDAQDEATHYNVFLNNVMAFDRVGNKVRAPINTGDNTFVSLKNRHIETRVTFKPEFLGQHALVDNQFYISTGTESPSDWKQITE